LEDTAAQVGAGIASTFPSLSDVELQIVVLNDFADASTSAGQQTPARFNDEFWRLEVNGPVFFGYPATALPGILAHEVGKFVAKNFRDLVSAVNEIEPDQQADVLAKIAILAYNTMAGEVGLRLHNSRALPPTHWRQTYDQRA
jgi:hypothetical protein